MRYECSIHQLLVEIETMSHELNRDTEYSYLLKIVVVEKDDPLQNNFLVLAKFPGLSNLFFFLNLCQAQR